MYSASNSVVIVRVSSVSCALPVGVVVETMRPLPIAPLADAPAGVIGTSVVRGAAIPVLDLAAVLGAPAGARGRFVVVRVGERRVALLVDEVVDVRAVPPDDLAAIPPLLRDAARDVVARIGALDRELRVVLDAARLVALDEARA
ncbi:MAG: chemotaxis protein CheW [Kofleriaceae bacterium]